ncbi:hypothetical protein MMC12_002373 [Toensbergia leucococca]|nr:hypothetical protein [Toensbergia leucococca]
MLFDALYIVTAQYLPDAQALTIKELEHLYFDSASNGFMSAITPCSNYIDPTTDDFVTANIYTQSGGLDASIGFETQRPENVGPAFNDALSFFSFFISDKVSMADLIALGTVMAVGACGGPHVELRGGRIDATLAGPFGVPEPETDISTTLTDFSNAGFNTGDTITLTTCGHTMGGVHRSIFPQVVPATAVGPTNTDGRVAFDETVAIFDIDTVNDYVHGTGNRGGSLVTTTNKTVQSDLRLYNSDQNSTIERLSQSADYFSAQCADIFQRMIETVPGSVQLTAAVDPTTTTNLKPADIFLSVDWKGNMTLSGFFRYIQIAGSTAAPSSLTVSLIGRNGKASKTSVKATTNLAKDTGTGIWGPTYSYPFILNFPATTGVSGLTVSGQTFSFQDSMFVVPALSSVSPSPPAFSTSPALSIVQTYTANTTVAYLTTTPPTSLTATFAIPTPQFGTVSPLIDTSTTASLPLIGKTGPYALYSAITTHSLSAKQAYGSSVDVAVTPGGAPGVMFFRPFVVAQ